MHDGGRRVCEAQYGLLRAPDETLRHHGFKAINYPLNES